MGFGAVFMEGNIDFYKNAGFVLASTLHIHYHAEPRESDVPYFLGLELRTVTSQVLKGPTILLQGIS
jgi:hypothetical protein